MPDLVALTRPDLESAAQQGILHPIDGLTTLLDDPDWFPYARPLAHIQNSAYGLPFAANLLTLRYQPAEDFPLPTIESLTEQELQILLPEDSTTLSFCLYDEENIEEESLTQLLSFYQSNLFTLTETQNSLPIQWSNDFLDETPADAILAPIPGPEGITCSLASAWIWSLAGSAPDLQPAAVELAEYLSDSTFLAEWTVAMSILPPRPTALDERKTTLHDLSLLAQPIPSNETIEALAEIFQAATISVLQEQVDPSAAAQEALENIQ
jgi:ABC-type glycerol-3-phosphate transport system substrate-binding protein